MCLLEWEPQFNNGESVSLIVIFSDLMQIKVEGLRHW